MIVLLAMGLTGADDHDFARLVPTLLGLRGVESLRTIPERKGQFAVPYNLVPTLVTFADLNDPKTARVVRPDQFEVVFGPGVRFRRAWIEITRDPITRTIEHKLPMLKLHREWMSRLYTEPGKFSPQLHFFSRS